MTNARSDVTNHIALVSFRSGRVRVVKCSNEVLAVFPELISMATLEVLNTVLACIFAILVCIMILFGQRYYQRRHNVAITERYPMIATGEVILSCIYIIGMVIYMLTPISAYDERRVNANYLAQYVLIDISYPLLIALWVLRFWMIRYDMKFAIATTNNQWMFIIDPNAQQLNDYAWYYKHKKSFGNSKWMFTRFLIPWLFILITRALVFILYGDDKDVYNVWTTFFYVSTWLLLALLFIIYWTIPRFQDFFFISAELKRLIILWLLATINDLVFFIAIELDFAGDSGPYFTVFFWMHWYVETVCMAITSLMATWWVLYKLESQNIVTMENSDAEFRQELETRASDSLITHDYTKGNKFEKLRKQQLQTILKSYEAFTAYITYLGKELSVKYLLAFIEIIQLQKYVIGANADLEEEMEAIDIQMFDEIEFYDDIPQSLIVYRDSGEASTLKEIKMKSDELYKKYIEYSSKYEVLITKNTRHEIVDIMSHIDWIDDDEIDIFSIMRAWDNVSKDLFSLLMDAFTRFQMTVQYNNLELTRTY